MSNGNGHHWSKFSWRDWSADKALHPCSLAAKGLWIELLCMMHEGTPIGHLTMGGKPATIRQMAANAYCSEKEAKKLLAELEEAGVFSRTDDGTIYCRRMVKDAAISETGREHIAKRWNGTKPTPPPNRDPNSPPNSPPTREPTRQPSRGPNSDPSRDPITQSQSTDSELELEKKVSKIKHLPSSFPVPARGVEASEKPAASPNGEDRASDLTQCAVKNIVGKVARKLESSGSQPLGKPPRLTVMAQQRAVLYGETIEPDGPRRGPVEPQRTVAEQLAALGHPQDTSTWEDHEPWFRQVVGKCLEGGGVSEKDYHRVVTLARKIPDHKVREVTGLIDLMGREIQGKAQ